MPINLHTGLPGAGKTLLTIDLVRKRAENENRHVYYLNINDLSPKLGWKQFESSADVPECPDGAIIVIDEAQNYYRPRPVGSPVPPEQAYYEKHRHKGHDIYLITQSPKLVDNHLRQLIETHRHFIRPWGKQKVISWEWNEVNLNTDKKRTIEYGQRFERKYPSDVFNLYKSSTLHTIQPRYPWRVWITPSLLAVAAIGGFVYWVSVHGQYEKTDEAQTIDITYGHSKDHRPDLKQAVLSRVVNGPSAMPLWMEALDGNSSDKVSFHQIIARVEDFRRQLVVDTSFKWIAGSALYSKDKLLKSNDYDWVSRVPETIKEAKELLQKPEAQINWFEQPKGYRIAPAIPL